MYKNPGAAEHIAIWKQTKLYLPLKIVQMYNISKTTYDFIAL